MLEPYSEGVRWICYAVRGIVAGTVCPILPLEGKVTANEYYNCLTDQLYPMMKHFYPDGSGLFQDDNTPIHKESLNGLISTKNT